MDAEQRLSAVFRERGKQLTVAVLHDKESLFVPGLGLQGGTVHDHKTRALLLQSADDLQKGTLPDTVVPDDANHIVPGGAKRHVFQYTAFSVKIKGDMLQPEKGIGRSSAWTESFT